MNVHLTPELEKMVQEKVKSGRYNSASEVVREALRIMEQRDEVVELQKDEMRRKIQEGWEALQRGEKLDGEAVFDRIERELDEMERKRAS